jgi:glutamate N-acetyltransferase/amino-acid N-acetyltransferase
MEIINGGSVTTPAGFVAGAVDSRIKKPGDLDLALIYSSRPCSAAAVFTRNQVAAAPVIVDRETLQNNRGHMHAVVANSGNANACTGQPGLDNARSMQRLVASQLGCDDQEVLVLSTGVIGVQLPMDRVATGIDEVGKALADDGGSLVAQAIMTTDTYPKHMALRLKLRGGAVTIGGIAKGAGMIHPNMATLLGVFTTDAVIEPDLLDRLLRTAINQSFNRISVDGDTSTNDTVLLLANGASGVELIDEEDISAFQAALNVITADLAKRIVRDGEGATKFVEINVSGAPDDEAAHLVAATIATSPLVKTAFAGSDANWGRILAAAGRAGVPFDQGQANLAVGVNDAAQLTLVDQGTPTGYEEADAAAIFREAAFKILLELGAGPGKATMWTSDLSHEYVTINADYRT